MIDFSKLLPEEIENIIFELQNILPIVKKDKNTTYKYINNEKNEIVCPTCKSVNCIKNGHTKSYIQTYKCNDCKRRFNDISGTVLEHTKLNYQQVEIFFECMDNKLSIRKTAKKMGVNKSTVFLLRHKVLDILSNIRKNIALKDKTQVDEKHESINLKGTKTENMPRYSKPRSTKGGSKRGVSKHQVCIASAIDETDQCFFEIVGTGPITTEQIRIAFSNKINSVDILITDCKSSYEKFASENGLRLEQVKSGTYVNENGFNLSEINSLHSGLDTFLSIFRGVSTKHLQGYLDWYTFQKLIHYTVDVLKHVSYTMKQIIVKPTSINSKNIFKSTCVINFNEIYSDYHHA